MAEISWASGRNTIFCVLHVLTTLNLEDVNQMEYCYIYFSKSKCNFRRPDINFVIVFCPVQVIPESCAHLNHVCLIEISEGRADTGSNRAHKHAAECIPPTLEKDRKPELWI